MTIAPISHSTYKYTKRYERSKCERRDVIVQFVSTLHQNKILCCWDDDIKIALRSPSGKIPVKCNVLRNKWTL